MPRGVRRRTRRCDRRLGGDQPLQQSLRLPRCRRPFRVRLARRAGHRRWFGLTRRARARRPRAWFPQDRPVHARLQRGRPASLPSARFSRSRRFPQSRKTRRRIRRRDGDGKTASGRRERRLSVGSSRLDRSVALASVAGLATLVLHLATSGGYGYERDELYFLWCAQHLAWGYVDQPPLIALVAKIATLLFGDSLVGIRLVAALAAAATVAVTGRIARRLGGGLFAQGIAMVALALAPFYLAVGSM